MLAVLAAATMALAPAHETLSPAEQAIQAQTLSHFRAAPARFCRAPVTASAGQPGSATTPLRCRPAPYYVSGRGRPKLERLVLTGSRVPVFRGERPLPPCLLIDDEGPQPEMQRVAD
jgi:hypothetical protein